MNRHQRLACLILCSMLLALSAATTVDATSQVTGASGSNDAAAVRTKELTVQNENANSEPDLTVTVDPVNTSYVRVKVSAVAQNGEDAIVRGRLSRRSMTRHGNYSGHVDIEVIAPDGSVHVELGVMITPYEIPRRQMGRSLFDAHFPYQFQDGAIVRVYFVAE